MLWLLLLPLEATTRGCDDEPPELASNHARRAHAPRLSPGRCRACELFQQQDDEGTDACAHATSVLLREGAKSNPYFVYGRVPSLILILYGRVPSQTLIYYGRCPSNLLFQEEDSIIRLEGQ